MLRGMTTVAEDFGVLMSVIESLYLQGKAQTALLDIFEEDHPEIAGDWRYQMSALVNRPPDLIETSNYLEGIREFVLRLTRETMTAPGQRQQIARPNPVDIVADALARSRSQRPPA